MTIRPLFMLVLFVLWSTSPVHAQTAQPSAQPQQSGDPDVVTERFRDWALSCRGNSQGGASQCSLFQRLVVQDTDQIALNVAIGFLRNEEGQQVPVAIFTFPLGIFLPGGVEMQVDSAEPRQLQIERCFQRGCQLGITLDDQLIAQFKAGSTTYMRVMQTREEGIELTVSLSGFSAGYNALVESTRAAN
jgi:invasion protein IalB